jgi:hypothetical protein
MDKSKKEQVKEGRTIYVSITRTVPPQVKMPNLIEKCKQAGFNGEPETIMSLND